MGRSGPPPSTFGKKFGGAVVSAPKYVGPPRKCLACQMASPALFVFVKLGQYFIVGVCGMRGNNYFKKRIKSLKNIAKTLESDGIQLANV